jgi:hypothetical protein
MVLPYSERDEMMKEQINVKEIERLNKDIVTLRREMDDMKDVIRGLIQFIMRKEDVDGEEYN